MKISDFLVSDFLPYDSCAEPEEMERIDFKVFMKVKVNRKEKPILNQKPIDIIRKSYRQEKLDEEAWRNWIERGITDYD